MIHARLQILVRQMDTGEISPVAASRLLHAHVESVAELEARHAALLALVGALRSTLEAMNGTLGKLQNVAAENRSQGVDGGQG